MYSCKLIILIFKIDTHSFQQIPNANSGAAGQTNQISRVKLVVGQF